MLYYQKKKSIHLDQRYHYIPSKYQIRKNYQFEKIVMIKRSKIYNRLIFNIDDVMIETLPIFLTNCDHNHDLKESYYKYNPNLCQASKRV